MSIAVSLKVHDGVVLAADSASTLFGKDTATGQVGVFCVYNNANKVFNLHKGLPIGAITWGLGGIGNASVATLAKDLRHRLMGPDDAPGADKLDKDKYSIKGVADRVFQFFFKEHYLPAFENLDEKDRPSLGLIVAGFSAKEALAEEWRIDISKGACLGPQPVRKKEDVGITWNGEGEAITRLVFGCGTLAGTALTEMGVPPEQVEPALAHLKRRMQVPFTQPAMPIQDAIDLARFLVETTEQFHRFAPGPPTVGGPVEIAVVTKHEGFKWVCRKLYYDTQLNPRS